MTPIHDRPYGGDADISAITRFLLDTYLLHQSLRNWEPRRWLGGIYHRSDADAAAYRAQLPQIVHLWLDASEQLLGVVIPEYDGGAFLQIHPQRRELEPAMLDWSEAHLAQTGENGQRWLEVWAYADDTFRNDLLHQRGYIRSEAHENTRRRPMTLPIPDAAVPEGYTVRAMRRHPDDWQHQADLLNAAFGRTFHNAEEYRNFQTSPEYRLDLDLVVEAPDGTLAANAAFTAYARESFAILEPVCTHPAHQGRGLAKAAILEGLRGIKALGIQVAYVGAWYSNAVSNHTYEALGFTDPAANHLWRREW